jgi:hypothetical protein
MVQDSLSKPYRFLRTCAFLPNRRVSITRIFYVCIEKPTRPHRCFVVNQCYLKTPGGCVKTVCPSFIAVVLKPRTSVIVRIFQRSIYLHLMNNSSLHKHNVWYSPAISVKINGALLLVSGRGTSVSVRNSVLNFDRMSSWSLGSCLTSIQLTCVHIHYYVRDLFTGTRCSSSSMLPEYICDFERLYDPWPASTSKSAWTWMRQLHGGRTLAGTYKWAS